MYPDIGYARCSEELEGISYREGRLTCWSDSSQSDQRKVESKRFASVHLYRQSVSLFGRVEFQMERLVNGNEGGEARAVSSFIWETIISSMS